MQIKGHDVSVFCISCQAEFHNETRKSRFIITLFMVKGNQRRLRCPSLGEKKKHKTINVEDAV